MLGEVGEDLREALGLDVAEVPGSATMFGFKNEGWKEWTTFDGTNVLVPDGFNTEPEADGSIMMYPCGDKSAPPCAKMPKGGFYFDSLIRQQPIDESKLDPEDNVEEYGLLSKEDFAGIGRRVKELYEGTDRALAIGAPGTGFGDIAFIPGPALKHPKGIRDVEEWYVSLAIRKDYVKKVFERQAEIGLENLKRLYEVVGDRVQVMVMDGTDLASQRNLFCSPEGYREMYMPYAKKLNDWIHENTGWITFKHCCGGCAPLIDDFIEAGYDILNPVQVSAQGMDPKKLKGEFGDRIVFWGGGVDTQQVLPFGSPGEVYEQVRRHVDIFDHSGGYVFNTVHNIQCGVPMENLLAMFKALGRDVPVEVGS
jgi:hypothetical protein